VAKLCLKVRRRLAVGLACRDMRGARLIADTAYGKGEMRDWLV